LRGPTRWGRQGDLCDQCLVDAVFLGYLSIKIVSAGGQRGKNVFKTAAIAAHRMQMGECIEVWLAQQKEVHQLSMIRDQGVPVGRGCSI